jgi:hypothetical protein
MERALPFSAQWEEDYSSFVFLFFFCIVVVNDITIEKKVNEVILSSSTMVHI